MERIEETIMASGTYDDDRLIRYVIVHFETSSGQVNLRADVSKQVFDEITPEKMVKIRYAETDPRIALLEGEF